MLLFGFNGRATRNFLILLVSMHYILFIDRVNLAAAASVSSRTLDSAISRSALLSRHSTTRTRRFSWSGAGLPTALARGAR